MGLVVVGVLVVADIVVAGTCSFCKLPFLYFKFVIVMKFLFTLSSDGGDNVFRARGVSDFGLEDSEDSPTAKARANQKERNFADYDEDEDEDDEFDENEHDRDDEDESGKKVCHVKKKDVMIMTAVVLVVSALLVMVVMMILTLNMP